MDLSPSKNFFSRQLSPDKTRKSHLDFPLKTTDGTVRVIFQNQKVDYIEFGKIEYSQEAIRTFASRCRDFFSELLESRGLSSNRLAIAPSFVCEQPFNEAKEILTSIYSENKLHFNDAEVDNCEFSQVFRPVKQIAGADVRCNFLAKFSTETEISVTNGVASQLQRIKADFDINTLPVNGLTFTVAAVQDFFNHAVDYCEEFYQFYFHN